MKNLFNKYRKYIITFSFAYVYILVVLLSPSGYMALTPGGINKVDGYEIEEVEFKNSINTVYVNSWKELTIFQKWLAEISNKISSEKQTLYKKSLTVSDERLQGEISKNSSHEQAIITAYEFASKKDSSIQIDYEFKGLYVYYSFNKFLNIGDLIVGIDEFIVDVDTNYSSFIDYFYEEIVIDDKIVKRPKKEMKLTLSDKSVIDVKYEENEQLLFFPKFDIKDTTPKYKEVKNKYNTGGPSGGAMQTLAIYTSLLGIDLEDLKIAGTGTIELTNNYEIGKIGGLVQKFYTVINKKVDVFFIPSSQYNENPYTDEEIQIFNLSKNVKTYPVKNFEDIINIVDEELLK